MYTAANNPRLCIPTVFYLKKETFQKVRKHNQDYRPLTLFFNIRNMQRTLMVPPNEHTTKE